MNETIPQLTISSLPDGNLRLESEDPMGNDTYIVDVHPIQVRLMAERLGLVPTSDVQAARRIEALSRRLRVLHGRLDRLSDYLLNHSDHRHADLSWELTYCTATLDIADEFVADLDGTAIDAKAHTEPTTSSTENGTAQAVPNFPGSSPIRQPAPAPDGQGATLPLDGKGASLPIFEQQEIEA